MLDMRKTNGVRCVVAVLALGSAAACHDPAAAVDDGACPQTYEFGNTGCAVVLGVVVGARGQALEGVTVFARVDPAGAGFASSYDASNPDGTFKVNIMRYAGHEPVDRQHDTLSVYVVAQNQPLAWALGQPKVRDSAFTTVRMFRVGEVPSPSNLTMKLDVP